MIADLVIGIDSSTTATKAVAWDRKGKAVAEGRFSHPLLTPKPGYFEQNAEDWWSSTSEALRQITKAVEPRRIAGLSVSNQRETFAPLDEQGHSLRPGMTWMDERGAPYLKSFSEAFGVKRLHRISGKTPDVTPAIYKMEWMRQNEPLLYARTAMFSDVHDYITFRLTGFHGTSVATADPHGFIDLVKRKHSKPILEALGVSTDQLPALFEPGKPIALVNDGGTKETGILAGTPIFAGGGDGQCAGTGVNVLAKGRAYMNLGTAVVSGAYIRDYAYHRAFRSILAVAEEGFIAEYCLRAGTFLIDTMMRQMFGIDLQKDKAAYARLEREANEAPIGSGGILVPYWLGSMTPHWSTAARGLMMGLAPWQGQGHYYRAMLEGIALDAATTYDAIGKVSGQSPDHFVAIGGGASSALFRQVIADATELPVRVLDTVEASSLGAGIAAAVGAGWYASFAEAAEAMTGRVTVETLPKTAHLARYRELRGIYADLWPSVAKINDRLAAFQAAG
jgi:sugar (pentulose or hexulose) kinase